MRVVPTPAPWATWVSTELSTPASPSGPSFSTGGRSPTRREPASSPIPSPRANTKRPCTRGRRYAKPSSRLPVLPVTTRSTHQDATPDQQGRSHRDNHPPAPAHRQLRLVHPCLLYTSDAADDLTRVDLGG